MAVYLDRPGVEECTSAIGREIEALEGAAKSIDSIMGKLTQYWQGAAADKAQATYAEEYKTMLTQTVPQAVEDFKKFIDGCKQAIIEVDTQLSGN